MFKIGDFVEFTNIKRGKSIRRKGIYAEKGVYGLDKVLHAGRAYWVNPDHIKPISIIRKDGEEDEPIFN